MFYLLSFFTMIPFSSTAAASNVTMTSHGAKELKVFADVEIPPTDCVVTMIWAMLDEALGPMIHLSVTFR